MLKKINAPKNSLANKLGSKDANEYLDVLQQDLRAAYSKYTGGADHDADLTATAYSLNGLNIFSELVDLLKIYGRLLTCRVPYAT